MITRAVAIATIPTPLKTDWADYHNTAVILASGGGFGSARPPGWPIVLSLLYRVAGPNPLAGEIFALVCAVGVGVLVYLIARRWLGDVAAAAGLFLWAISPGPAAFSAVLASEHLHDVLFVAAFGLALLALERRWVAWLGVGVLLALSQYVRPIGLVLVPAFALLPFLAGVPRRRAAAAAITIVVAFGLILAPSIVSQYQRYGRVSLSTSNFDGWNLLVGLNVKSGGQYSRDDLALVNAAPDTVEFRDRSYRLAIERLTQHPGAVLTLAVPKFETMWGDSTYGATWTLGGNRPGHPRERPRWPSSARSGTPRSPCWPRPGCGSGAAVAILSGCWPCSASRPSPCRRPCWRSSPGTTPSSSRSCASSPARRWGGSRSG